jgi:hypothetical protein
LSGAESTQQKAGSSFHLLLGALQRVRREGGEIVGKFRGQKAGWGCTSFGRDIVSGYFKDFVTFTAFLLTFYPQQR